MGPTVPAGVPEGRRRAGHSAGQRKLPRFAPWSAKFRSRGDRATPQAKDTTGVPFPRSFLVSRDLTGVKVTFPADAITAGVRPSARLSQSGSKTQSPRGNESFEIVTDDHG